MEAERARRLQLKLNNYNAVAQEKQEYYKFDIPAFL